MAGSLIAPIAGAAIGGLTGSKSQTGTVQTRPYLPKNYEEGYARLLEDALKTYETPFRPVERRRADLAPSGEYGGLFFNPELADIQRQEDAKYMATMFNPPVDAAPQQAQQQAAMQSQIDAQDWLSRQRSRYLPATRQYQSLDKIKNTGALGELLSAYQDKYGQPAGSMDYLISMAQGNPDLMSKLQGIY